MLWTVISENAKTKEVTHWTANVIVQATGLYNRAKVPSIPGISDFKGEIWHTMNWPVDPQLEGKRVAVIGTGPSAIQVIPSIQPIVKSLTVYQRSPVYCIPREDFRFSPFIKSLFKRLPFIHYLYCLVLHYTMEIIGYWVFRPDNKIFPGHMIKTATQHLHNQVKDPVLRKRLQQKPPFGCKRVLISDVYYPAFEKSNVDLITDPVMKITSSGVISKPVSLIDDSELNATKTEGGDEDTEIKPELYTAEEANDSCQRSVDVDVIIWGTGYQVRKFGSVYKVIGRSGQTLEQHWQEECNSLYGIKKYLNFLTE
jgi:cation diffusion facilitator CzcD-associated flavoprotein CzcO